MKLEKFLCITTLSISISGAFLAPVFAQNIQPAGYDQNVTNTVATRTTRVAWISEINGSTATVIYRNGSSEDIPIASEDVSKLNVAQGNYVSVTDGHIDGIVRVGRVVGIVGSIVTIKLNDGQVDTVQVPPRLDTSLKLGKYVYVSGGRVVAVANNDYFPKYTAVKASNIDFTPSQPAPIVQPVRHTEVQQVQSAPVQAAPEPAPQPIKGMW